MVPFLRQVAEKYFDEGGLDRKCFVFPNRRSMMFFRRHLADVAKAEAKPVIAPSLVTMNDFFYRLYGGNVTDRVSLLLELYECYRRLNAKAEPLDEFIFWGDIILGDFNDVDKYLVDPKQLFTNVSDIKSIQDNFEYLSDRQRKALESFVSHFTDRGSGRTSVPSNGSRDVKERFLMIWNILYPLYLSYRERLQSKGMAYEGMVYRSIAESVGRHGTAVGEEDIMSSGHDVFPGDFNGIGKFVFVGLNALNECEKTVMRRMRDMSLAEFCWDYSGKMIKDRRNKSSFFMEENVKEFPQKYGWDPDGVPEPDIRVISVPSSTGQVKQLPSVFRYIADTQAGGDLSMVGSLSGADCAVVLPDETLLMPLLNTVPPEIREINVTMGYPMTGSDFYGMMSSIAVMQMHMRQRGGVWGFYYRPVWTLFSNGILKRLMTEAEREIVRNVKSGARLYVPEENLKSDGIFGLIFRPVVKDPKTADKAAVDDFGAYLMEIAGRAAAGLGGDADMVLEMDFAREYYRCAGRLRQIAPVVQPVTYIRILEQLLSGVTVPFKGEPLKGLQIMGPLETRALDFRNLVILSANEGIFPRRNVSSSFIPPELRKGFGLPTYEYQDAVWAYYFYRMITRAENVWILYDSRTEGLRSGEESRYVRQLEYHFRLPLKRYVADTSVMTGADEDTVMKTAADVDVIRQRDLSATALQNYLACPVKFYYQTVKMLRPEEEVAESLDASMIGNVFHRTMQCLYSGEEAMKPGAVPVSCFMGRRTIPVTARYLKDWMKRTGEIKAKVRSLIMEALRSNEVEGRNLVIEDVIVRYVLKTLERDLEVMRSKETDRFEILGLEENLRCSFNGFRIKGIVDRIDSFSPDEIRVVDYKTGKVSPEEMDVSDAGTDKIVANLFGDKKYRDKPKIALQLFIYDLLIENNVPDGDRRLLNSVYSTVKIFSEPPLSVEVGKSFVGAMKERVADMLREIEDVSIPFRRTDDPDVCAFCDFRSICGRG